MPTCALYLRESTSQQDLSPKIQESQARAYADLRGFTVVDVLHDAAISAAVPFQDRPSAPRVRKLIASGAVDALVAAKLDRMFRDVVDCLTNVDLWDRRGVALHLVDMGGNAVDTRSAAGRFMLTVLAAAAEMERNRIRERTRESARRRKANLQVYGPVPFGFRRACDHCHHDAATESVPGCRELVRVYEEQYTIRSAKTLRGDGKSYAKIADALNRHRHATRRGGPWRASTVQAMLKNSIHAA